MTKKRNKKIAAKRKCHVLKNDRIPKRVKIEIIKPKNYESND